MGIIWLKDMSVYNKYRFFDWSNEKRIEFIEMLLYKRVNVLLTIIDKRHPVSLFTINRDIRKVDNLIEYLEKIKSTDYSKEEQTLRLDSFEKHLFGSPSSKKDLIDVINTKKEE